METRTRLMILCGLTCLLALAGCSKPAEQAKDADKNPVVRDGQIFFPAEVKLPAGIATTPARTIEIQILPLAGRLVWNEDVTVRISTPFNGRVAEIRVHAGAAVKAGEVLAAIASPDFGQAQAQLRKAESELHLAKQNLGREKELFEHGATARKQLEEAEAALGRAQAEFESTRKRLQLYGQDTDSIDQSYLVRSPLTGVIVERAINPGQELQAGQDAHPLFVVSDPRTLWVELLAHEEEADSLRVGMVITLFPRQDPLHKVQGVIEQISDFVDPATRTLKVRGVVPNPDRKFKAEMYVNAEVAVPVAPLPMVPAQAVYLLGEKHYLFVRGKDGGFRRKEVRIGVESGGLVPVLEGVAAGEDVVAKGVLYLQQILVNTD